MAGLMLEVEGPPGVFAVFSEDEGAGYLFVYQPASKTVLAQVRIYVWSQGFSVSESDIEVMWSTDRKKCGVAVWGRMRGIIDIAIGKEICAPLVARDSPPVSDLGWLEGFEEYFDHNMFVRARQNSWKTFVKEHVRNVRPLPEGQTPIQTNVIVSARGPDNCFGVFEDDGETGYLYIYEPDGAGVTRHLHIYDRKPTLNPEKRDVAVRWSTDNTKCAVSVWGKMRGIIDLSNNREGRVWLENRDTPGIGDKEWLDGFDY